MGKTNKSIINQAKKYKLIKGIPSYVKDDMYVKNFSHEWSIHKQTQLDNSPISCGLQKKRI